MAPLKEARGALREGFEGEIDGLGLSDLIQLGVHNRFSGCIHVQADRGSGRIFLRDGEIVHAEQGGQVGEEAFYDILKWPAGRFSLQRNVSSTRSTIRKGWQHLILEAHRVIDEEAARLRPGLPGGGDGEDEGEGRPAERAGMMERLRRIPGVASVVLQRMYGVPLGDDSYEAEVLAGQALYLAMVSKQLGSIFRTGEVLSATVEGQSRHLLLFAASGHFLSVLVHGDAQVRAVETEVRKALAGSR
jgi:predicted regulator of Ras-like GTPase activity (Roadblock/LC7/MglB family)